MSPWAYLVMFILPISRQKSIQPTLTVIVAVQSLSHIWLFATPWTAVRQASPSFTVSWSFLKLMSIESVLAIYFGKSQKDRFSP